MGITSVVGVETRQYHLVETESADTHRDAPRFMPRPTARPTGCHPPPRPTRTPAGRRVVGTSREAPYPDKPCGWRRAIVAPRRGPTVRRSRITRPVLDPGHDRRIAEPERLGPGRLGALPPGDRKRRRDDDGCRRDRRDRDAATAEVRLRRQRPGVQADLRAEHFRQRLGADHEVRDRGHDHPPERDAIDGMPGVPRQPQCGLEGRERQLVRPEGPASAGRPRYARSPHDSPT